MDVCLSLYVDGVWISTVICEVWMKIEKNCEVWIGTVIMLILVKIDVMIPCLLLFWMSFDVYKPMYKFWWRIWVKGDQK